MRTTFDFSPLYRNTVGFDRIAQLLEAANQPNASSNNYPPYDIEVTGENEYAITIAVAGFAENELEIESENSVLFARGKKEKNGETQNFLHQGIAYRSFERKFQLADYVKVVGAGLEHGLLKIHLQKEIPEAMKPKKIEINGNRVLNQKT